jgi:hypothetical protein
VSDLIIYSGFRCGSDNYLVIANEREYCHPFIHSPIMSYNIPVCMLSVVEIKAKSGT